MSRRVQWEELSLFFQTVTCEGMPRLGPRIEHEAKRAAKAL